MNRIFSNWKTTGAGVSTILLAIVHLVFQALEHKADETAWTTAVVAIIGGLGLVAAGDADKSVAVTEIEALKGNVAKAIENGDTSFLKKQT